jgi:hypothetical protein
MVRSIPLPSALFAGKNPQLQPEDASGEIHSLAKGMYVKRIEDERYTDENYYHPDQPCLVYVSEDLLTDAAPYPFHNPVQTNRNVKEEVPTGQVIMKFYFRKWGCGSPLEDWGITDRHIYPPVIQARMDKATWTATIDEINDGLIKYPWPKLIWFPLVFGAVLGGVLEGSLRTVKSLEAGVVFAIFTVAGVPHSFPQLRPMLLRFSLLLHCNSARSRLVVLTRVRLRLRLLLSSWLLQPFAFTAA